MAKSPNISGILDNEVSSVLRYKHSTSGSSFSVNNTKIIVFAGSSIINEGDVTIGTIVNDANEGWSFTALKDCEVSAVVGWSGNGAYSIDATGAELDTTVFSIPLTKVIGYQSDAAGNQTSVANVPLKVGEVLRIHSSSGGLGNDLFGFSATARTKIIDLI